MLLLRLLVLPLLSMWSISSSLIGQLFSTSLLLLLVLVNKNYHLSFSLHFWVDSIPHWLPTSKNLTQSRKYQPRTTVSTQNHISPNTANTRGQYKSIKGSDTHTHTHSAVDVGLIHVHFSWRSHIADIQQIMKWHRLENTHTHTFILSTVQSTYQLKAERDETTTVKPLPLWECCFSDTCCSS